MWNKCHAWDKTKVYKNSKLGENGIWFDVWENFFFFTFLFLCQNHYQVSINWESFCFFVFCVCQSPLRLQLHIQKNFRWSQGGRCPPSPPSGSATGGSWSIWRTRRVRDLEVKRDGILFIAHQLILMVYISY